MYRFESNLNHTACCPYYYYYYIQGGLTVILNVGSNLVNVWMNKLADFQLIVINLFGFKQVVINNGKVGDTTWYFCRGKFYLK